MSRNWAGFHIVVRGECLIDRLGRARMRLKAGDILLLPHGSAHPREGALATTKTSRRSPPSIATPHQVQHGCLGYH